MAEIYKAMLEDNARNKERKTRCANGYIPKYHPISTMKLSDLYDLKVSGKEMYYQGVNDQCNKDGFGIIHNLEQVRQCKKIKNIWIKN